MRAGKRESRNFVQVQVESLHDEDFASNGERLRRTVLNVPVSAVERLVERGIITYNDRYSPPFVLDPQFDDLALAIPGSFITRN